jgi:hypothetical protein
MGNEFKDGCDMLEDGKYKRWLAKSWNENNMRLNVNGHAL